MDTINTNVFKVRRIGDSLLEAPPSPDELVENLLYTQGIHLLYSPGGTGKTVMALWSAIKAMERGQHVLYLDQENMEAGITRLLKPLGATPELLDEYFGYLEAPELNKETVVIWEDLLEEMEPDLVVFDSLADHLVRAGADENSSNDITEWFHTFAQPAKDIGACVLILDHIAKNENTKGARGSTAKMSKTDVAWKFERKSIFNKDALTEVTLTIEKDRFGTLPHKRKFRVGGDGFDNLLVEPTDTIEEEPPRPLNDSENKALNSLWTHFDEYGATFSEWKGATSGISESSFKTARKYLVSQGYVTQEDKRYRLAEKGQLTARVSQGTTTPNPSNGVVGPIGSEKGPVPSDSRNGHIYRESEEGQSRANVGSYGF